MYFGVCTRTEEGKRLSKGTREYTGHLVALWADLDEKDFEWGLAEAMEARAWGAAKKRTSLYVLRIGRRDYLLLFGTIIMILLAIYIRLYISIPQISKLLLP